MNKLKRLLFILAIAGAGNQAYAQFDESGIAAGFFDSSNDKEINFSEFHLPPLAILFENAKANPQILSLEKARQIAQAEVAKQKRHIFSYVTGLSILRPKKDTEIASANRLSIDGSVIGRGWDNIYSNKGDFMWTNAFELRAPVVPNIISAQFFLDAVALKDQRLSMRNRLGIDDFYFSFGPGLRSLVPQLPLSIYIVNTFTMKDGKFSWGNGKYPEWKPVLSFTVTNM